ncbi:transcription initiation factor TFIID subunit 6 [Caerostris extrusa]|uniref:Transcription initiation factor TFIID subunit 6 n=1 Tax=Caerostris extrusa TaxID=172846 RepID=A0AAV4NKK8_CAEEX|nr:transcription initiation factor TFIID subunit 6 [Caerostris extrusa]
MRIPTHITIESVKTIVESVGVSNLSDEAAKLLADDVTYRIKTLIQDSKKFMAHAKRKRLTAADLDYTLKIKILNLFMVLSQMNSSLFVMRVVEAENFISQKRKRWN